MAHGKFISYLRVSTQQQGRSGLGLEAQRKAVTDYLNGGKWELLAEFVEVESGKRNDRPQLKQALDRCRLTGSTLVVAKIDRLARDAAFLLNLRDAGVDFVAADMPDANRMTVGIMAIIAEHERDAISARTKAALAAAKARGIRLGKPENLTPIDAERGRELGRAAKSARAAARTADLEPVIRDIVAGGRATLAQIAEALNDRHIPTSRGGAWSPTQVARVMDRLSMRPAIRLAA
jgi:DNA invertase Pin-like site-specific DNA recombinase